MPSNSETFWTELEARAQRLLEHAREVEPREPVRRHGSILRLWHYPAYGPLISWTLLRSGRKKPKPTGSKVREVTWDRAPDIKRLFDSQELRTWESNAAPTIQLRETDLDD